MRNNVIRGKSSEVFSGILLVKALNHSPSEGVRLVLPVPSITLREGISRGGNQLVFW